MTRDETKLLMKEVAVLFPRFINQQEDRTMKVDLWTEALRDDDFQKIHEALIEYARSDNKGYAPSAGQLIELMKKNEDDGEYADSDFLV